MLGAGAAVTAVVVACTSSTPKQAGDDLINDVPPTAPTNSSPPPTDPGPPDDAGISLPDGYVDLDGYAPIATCAMCNCDPDASYCFGGANGHYQFSGQCNWVDASPEAGFLEVGCHLPPNNCAPLDCSCLIAALKGVVGCYPVCAIKAGSAATLYCPNP